MSETYGPHIKYPLRLLDFPGFYQSYLSEALDYEEEQTAENECGRQEEKGIASELRLDEGVFGEILMDCANYAQMHEDMCEAWAEALDEWCTEHFGFETNMHFHSMWSPREYNFSSDQLTVWVPESTIRTLMVRSLANGHDVLAAVIKDNFTSRSGFISNYENDLESWVSKPMLEWDDIELGVLLAAAAEIGRDRHEDGMIKSVSYATTESETCYCIVQNNIDWPKFEAAVLEKRAELEELQRIVDPDYVAPPMRCDQTLDLFERRAA